MQYTIEARELTNEYRHRAVEEEAARRTTIEARDANEAISRFVRANSSELVSFTSPGTSRESIATVRKDDSVYLVRVYAN